MSAIISDVATKRLVPAHANAMCNAGGKMLKMVELEMKYGDRTSDTGRKTLKLAITAPDEIGQNS